MKNNDRKKYEKIEKTLEENAKKISCPSFDEVYRRFRIRIDGEDSRSGDGCGETRGRRASCRRRDDSSLRRIIARVSSVAVIVLSVSVGLFCLFRPERDASPMDVTDTGAFSGGERIAYATLTADMTLYDYGNAVGRNFLTYYSHYDHAKELEGVFYIRADSGERVGFSERIVVKDGRNEVRLLLSLPWEESFEEEFSGYCEICKTESSAFGTPFRWGAEDEKYYAAWEYDGASYYLEAEGIGEYTDFLFWIEELF